MTHDHEDVSVNWFTGDKNSNEKTPTTLGTQDTCRRQKKSTTTPSINIMSNTDSTKTFLVIREVVHPVVNEILGNQRSGSSDCYGNSW